MSDSEDLKEKTGKSKPQSSKKKKDEKKQTSNQKKRKNVSSPEPSTSLTYKIPPGRKKTKLNSDDEWEETRDTNDVDESFVIKLGNITEEKVDRFQLETYHHNLQFVAIDEICLEGLDGITLEALWTRLSTTLNYSLPFPTLVENFFWNIIISKDDIEFFKLQEPRPKLVVYDRFKNRDPELGEVHDCVEVPLDIYPYHPINCRQVMGSAASFETRIDVTEEVRQLSLAEAQERYGSQLVLVATQRIREKAICNPIGDPVLEYTPIQYCLLERIARSRSLGEITQGKVSLQVMSKDPKVIFYNRKILADNYLITKQLFNLKTANTSHLSGTLFHIFRFYKKHKTKSIAITQQIVEYLRNKSDHRIEYTEAKKVFGHETVLRKLFKLPEFQKFVKTDVPRFCRELYPDNSEKWFCSRSTKPKLIRTLELIDPNANVAGLWHDDDQKEESSDEEITQELMFKMPVLHQVYDFIRKAGQDGCSLKEIQANKGLDYYSTRAAVNQLLNQKVVIGTKIDIGRQRLMRYQTAQAHWDTINVEDEEEKQQLELEAVDFISDLLEVDQEFITRPVREEKPKLNPIENNYTHIKNLRLQSKQNPENAATLNEAYKNQHCYSKENSVLTFVCGNNYIPEHISNGILQSWCVSRSHYPKKKKLTKFYHKIRQTNEFDDSYVSSILNVQCSLTYQSLMCEESYRRLLKNVIKLSHSILINCSYKVKNLLPRKRYMCKQQLSLSELQTITETHFLVADPLSDSNLKRQPQTNEEPAKRIRLEEEDGGVAIKEMFMGPNPRLAYETVDSEGIRIAVWISTTPEEFAKTDLPYIKENNITLRTVKRANLILEAVQRESIITDTYRLQKSIQSLELEEGYHVKADRKSFQRIYARLVRRGLIKILQVVLKSVRTRRVITVLCDPSLDVRHSIIESVIEQLKMKIFVPKKKVSNPENSQTSSEVRTFNTSEITSSVSELEMLVDKDQEYTPNRTIGKEYGYLSKFLRIRVLHEFLFHLIYNYPTGQEVKDVPKMLEEFDILMDKDDIKDIPTVYCREISWRMFIPPLTSHIGWPEGWALVCDVLLRLPLSLFVKLCNVTLMIPDLPLYLEHPVKQHYLVKHLPSEIRSGLLYRRKYIFSIHETLSRLAYIGLLQFGPQKLREKDQVFIYLNRNASLYDTTTTGAGYHYIEDKEYKKLQYRFLTNTDVETYWYEMWNICTHSNLGMRNVVVGTYITIEHLEAKPAMVAALKARTAESAALNDNGNIPGDRRGAAGLDSALWSHIKRNWNVSSSSSPAVVQSNRPKKLKRHKKEELEREIQNKKPPSCAKRKRKSCIIRKVNERIDSKKKKKDYDIIDKKLMANLKQCRSEWSYEEDLLLNICKLVSTFLCPNYRKQIVYYTVIRDTLHCLIPCSANKTSGACQRRLSVLFGSVEQQEHLQQIVKALIHIPFVKKYFQKFYDHVCGGSFLREKLLQGAFIFLVIYFFENQHELQHIFEAIHNKSQCQLRPHKSKLNSSFGGNAVLTIKKQDSEMNVLAYNAMGPVVLPNKSSKLYPDLPVFPKSEDDVTLDTIKSIIHSTIAVRPDDVSCIYQLFRVYQGYSDDMLKTAINEVRNSQMVTAKRTAKKQTDMKGLPITSKLFYFSFYYGFAQVTKFPVELFLEAHEFLLGIYTHREKLLPSAGNGLPTECFQQGHLIALSEVVLNVAARFIVNFPKEVLILNPRITDHTELLRELAVRYKKMLTLVKDGSYFKDDQQNEGTEKHCNRTPMIQRFLKTWFLSNDKDEEDDNEKVVIGLPEDSNEDGKKRKRFVHMSTSKQILKSLNEDIHQPPPSTSTSKRFPEKLKIVHVDSTDSFEDYEKKLENLLSTKTTDDEATHCASSTQEEDICHSSLFERYLSKGKEKEKNVAENRLETSEEEIIPIENVETVETDADGEINDTMTSIINNDISVEEVMEEMLNDSPSEKRRVPNVIKLSRLLVKGLFPDLDEDEERLERLHQHFLVVCPDTNLTIESFEDNKDLSYLYFDHPIVCKNLLRKVQKDIIINDHYPSDQEIAKRCEVLEYSNDDVVTVHSLKDFILKKNVLGASVKELKKSFPDLNNQRLTSFLNILIDMNVILRTGIIYTIFVHYRHRKHWLVESCTLEYQDKMKLENTNTDETSSVDISALAKSLDSYKEMKIHVKPWARIDGTLNLKMFEKWLCTILGHCLADMSISLSAVINLCTYLKPVDVYYLVECLQEMQCVKMFVFVTEKCGLTTELSYAEPVSATIVDEFDDIYIETDKSAIIKFGTLLNKKMKEFNFPADVAQRHDSF